MRRLVLQYDPNVIKRLGALMVKPDVEIARKWYQLAANVIIALQPSMLSWNPAVTGRIGLFRTVASTISSAIDHVSAWPEEIPRASGIATPTLKNRLAGEAQSGLAKFLWFSKPRNALIRA
jgi:hypothetical protein